MQQLDESFVLKSSSAKTKIAFVGVLARMRLLKETVEAISRMDDVEMHIGGFGEFEAWIQDLRIATKTSSITENCNTAQRWHLKSSVTSW